MNSYLSNTLTFDPGDLKTQKSTDTSRQIQIHFSIQALFIWAEVISVGEKTLTSEISPCYENNMKIYIVFIWDKTFPVYRDLAC